MTAHFLNFYVIAFFFVYYKTPIRIRIIDHNVFLNIFVPSNQNDGILIADYMKPEETDIGFKFVDFNELYFECELPFPNLEIIHSSKNLGLMTCDFDEYDNIVSATISITDYYDFTESQFDDVMLHEMIHYYLAWTKQDVSMSHGKEFKRMMRMFNKEYKTNIQVVTNSFKLKRNKNISFWRRLLSYCQ